MNKRQFLDSLQLSLQTLGPAAVRDILGDFDEHFAGGTSRGKSEEEIAAELGDPAEIAQQYLDAASGSQAGQGQAAASESTGPARAAASDSAAKPNVNEMALIAVILLNIFFGIPVWIALFATLFGCWAAAGGIGVAAIVLFAVAIIQTGMISLILALLGLALTALAVLMVILMVFISKWLVTGCVQYIRWNKRLVLGRQTA
jgi:uncharacterized membrane protein